MPKFTDKLFRKIFIGLVTLAVMLVLILSMHMLFQIPLDSRVLWSGNILVFVAINLIFDINGITKKIIILGVSSIVIGVFLNSVLNWPLIPSLVMGIGILIISALLYMTFLN